MRYSLLLLFFFLPSSGQRLSSDAGASAVTAASIASDARERSAKGKAFKPR